MKNFVLLLLILFSQSAYCIVAKVTLVKGKVYAIKGDKKVLLKKGAVVTENTTIESSLKSIARIKLPDNSQVTIAPKSTLAIEKFKQAKKPSLVSLASGAVRALVPPEKNKNTKMVIKTKSAVMGIRGTDMEVIYNPENNISSTITFHGDVAMAPVPEIPNLKSIMANIDENSQSVKKGEISTTHLGKSITIKPATKLSPIQFEGLRKNETFEDAKEKTATNSKKIIPPGLSVKKVIPAVEGIESKLGLSEEEVSITEEEESNPEIDSDSTSKKGKPVAGGFIDIKTALYIPPPPGSAFDPNAGVFIPSEEMGKVDPETGEFLLVDGIKISPEGEILDTQTGEVREDIVKINFDISESDLETTTQTEDFNNEGALEIAEAEPDILEDPTLEDPNDTFDDQRDVSNVNINIKVNLQ